MRRSDVSGIEISIWVAIVLTLITVVALPPVACRYKAKGLGLVHTWGPLQGCIVTRPDGVKVAIENYGRAN